jgi:osmoprotectant transport system permease protein
MTAALLTHPVLAGFGGALDFILHKQSSNVTGGKEVGGFGQVLELAWTQIEVSLLALAVALLIAVPLGLYFGHKGAGELLAVGLGNAGRAVPELAVIALIAIVIGVGVPTLAAALALLGIPPILTNTFVGIRQVDRATIDAARGAGMTEVEILRKVELPLAVPTIMTGVRTAAINIIATATIAPLAGVVTLGDYIINGANYGSEGVLAGAIMVALLALTAEILLSAVQRILTPRGLSLARERVAATG